MGRKTVLDGAAGTWAPAVGEHLKWIRDVLGELDLPAARRDKLWSALRTVQTRADDPELRIAVFGEASSGKSTLLNAFLRRRLLPSSARVTTTVTTVLRHHEGTEGLRLRTADGTGLDWPSAAFDQWADGRQPPSAGTPSAGTPSADTLEAALARVLTTDLALAVRDLEVRSPVRPLGDGVAVLDTPGFSVTDPGHREMAEAAVGRADLAVVVVPAVAAMSMTLADFLTGPLLGHHDRCVFVITKIDLVDEGERDATVAFVADRLRSIGIADPLLLPCAPGRALREAEAPDRGSGAAVDHPGHLARFRAVEQRLVRLAAERREAAIAATVLTLLSQLLAAVEEIADAQRAEHGRAGRGLAALSLPDFPGFLDTWTRRVVDRVNTGTRVAATSAPVGSGRSGLDEKVVAAVADNKIDNIREAASEVSGIVGRHLRKEARKTARAAARQAGELLSAEAGELARDFAAQYGALAGLAGETPAAPVVPVTDLDLPEPDLSEVDAALTAVGTELISVGNWRTGGGAAAGAVIGSFIAPGIGTVIGGALGAMMGTRGRDTARAQFLEKARPVIATAYAEVDALHAVSLQRIAEAVEGSVAALRQKYEAGFSDEIARLTLANERQRAALAAAVAAAERTAAGARERREQVAVLRRRTSGTVHAPKEA
ncbi:dynamin family protein [Streptomyces sp. NPDC048282]|uniref:dynamin family protein n=1 Tax=Streptomyces sp. NPDC048282 TaxID=3365528 RepID=UPI0037167989